MRMASVSVLVMVSRRASLRIFSIPAEPLESLSRAEARSSSNWSMLTRCPKGAVVNGQTKLDTAFSRWSPYFRPCDNLIFPPWEAANSSSPALPCCSAHLSARQLIFLHFFPTQPLGTGAFIGLARKDIQRVGNSPSSPLPPSISLRTHLTTLSFSPQTRGEVK
ncbi:hypothetical protein F5148DRAFT_1232165 [Russula earlei]|uniref:Uncharacterized protein n=1 Tax=Russula earlei TaxID=71964 RepID=A0ACC0U044_9AGAM|nr:hypothetical protein F5148DRAFT_1232165 [Russula earlei]